MLGDYKAGAVIDLTFTTRSNGVPTALSGGTVSVYKGNSATESTAGVTLTSDFDSRTGLNQVHITTASDGTFYAGPNEFSIVITAGTVGGVSVVGAVVDTFSIGRASADIAAVQADTDDIAAIKAKTDNLPASPAATSDIPSAATVAAATAATVTSDHGAGSYIRNTEPLDASGVRAAVGLGSANLDTQIDALPTNAELATALASADDATLAAIAALSIPTISAIADGILLRNIASGSDGGRTVRDALRVLRNKVVIVPINSTSGTINVYDESDAAIVWTGTVTRADVDAMTAVDPA